MPWMEAMLISSGGWPGGMCIVPLVDPFADWAMPKGGVEILHDGITLSILTMMWYSCYPSWYLAFSLCFSGE